MPKKKMNRRCPTSPGEMLLCTYMKPYKVTQARLSEAIRLPLRRVQRILRNEDPIDPDLALRLSYFFGTSPELWMNLQNGWDLWHREYGEHGSEYALIAPVVWPEFPEKKTSIRKPRALAEGTKKEAAKPKASGRTSSRPKAKASKTSGVSASTNPASSKKTSLRPPKSPPKTATKAKAKKEKKRA